MKNLITPLLAIMFVSLFAFGCNRGNETTVDVHVTKTFTQHRGESDHFMINGVDLQTGERVEIEISDDLFTGNFTSGDIFSFIDEGYCYKFVTYGERNNFWSWYPWVRSMPTEIDCYGDHLNHHDRHKHVPVGG